MFTRSGERSGPTTPAATRPAKRPARLRQRQEAMNRVTETTSGRFLWVLAHWLRSGRSIVWLPQAPRRQPQPALTGFPFTDEDLNYSVNWPTRSQPRRGASARQTLGRELEFHIDTRRGRSGICGERYVSLGHRRRPNFCSVSFDRSLTHGSHKVQETGDHRPGARDGDADSASVAAQIPVPACVKDALAYLFYCARREMGQGRVPAAQEMLFGAPASDSRGLRGRGR